MKYIYILPIYFTLKRLITYFAIKRNKIMGPLFYKLYELSTLTTNSVGYKANLKLLNSLGHNTRLPFRDILGELEYRLGSNDYEKVIKILGAVDLTDSWNRANKLYYFSFYYKLFMLANLFHVLNLFLTNTLKLLGLGFLVSIYNFKFNLFSDYPLINIACNYLLIQFKKWLGLDYRYYLKYFGPTPEEIDNVVKTATRERENVLIDATQKYNQRMEIINNILSEKVPEVNSLESKERKYFDSFADDEYQNEEHNNNKLLYYTLAAALGITCILWGLDSFNEHAHEALRKSEWMTWYLDNVDKVPAFFLALWSGKKPWGGGSDSDSYRSEDLSERKGLDLKGKGKEVDLNKGALEASIIDSENQANLLKAMRDREKADIERRVEEGVYFSAEGPEQEAQLKRDRIKEKEDLIKQAKGKKFKKIPIASSSSAKLDTIPEENESQTKPLNRDHPLDVINDNRSPRIENTTSPLTINTSKSVASTSNVDTNATSITVSLEESEEEKSKRLGETRKRIAEAYGESTSDRSGLLNPFKDGLPSLRKVETKDIHDSTDVTKNALGKRLKAGEIKLSTFSSDPKTVGGGGQENVETTPAEENTQPTPLTEHKPFNRDKVTIKNPIPLSAQEHFSTALDRMHSKLEGDSDAGSEPPLSPAWSVRSVETANLHPSVDYNNPQETPTTPISPDVEISSFNKMVGKYLKSITLEGGIDCKLQFDAEGHVMYKGDDPLQFLIGFDNDLVDKALSKMYEEGGIENVLAISRLNLELNKILIQNQDYIVERLTKARIRAIISGLNGAYESCKAALSATDNLSRSITEFLKTHPI